MGRDAAPELDDDACWRLWVSVLRRARQDARGVGASGQEQQDALDWLESGAALDLLRALGVSPGRAEAFVESELEAINNTNGKGKR